MEEKEYFHDLHLTVMAMKWGKVLYDKNKTQREVKKQDGKVVYRRRKKGVQHILYAFSERSVDRPRKTGRRRRK